MTDVEAIRREVRAAREKATPGPWSIVDDDSGQRPVQVPSIVAPEDLDCAIVHWDGFWQQHWQSARGVKEMNANARLIAATVNHWPTLEAAYDAKCAEVEKLRKEVALLEEEPCTDRLYRKMSEHFNKETSPEPAQTALVAQTPCRWCGSTTEVCESEILEQGEVAPCGAECGIVG